MLTSADKYVLCFTFYNIALRTIKLGSINDDRNFNEIITDDYISEVINSLNIVDNYSINSDSDSQVTITSIVSENIFKNIFKFLKTDTSESIYGLTQKFLSKIELFCGEVYLNSLLDIDQNLLIIQKKSLTSEYTLDDNLDELLDNEFEQIDTTKLRRSIQFIKIHKFLKKFITNNPNLTTEQLQKLISNNIDNIISEIKQNILDELSNPSFPDYL
jgi:hypothetical protein